MRKLKEASQLRAADLGVDYRRVCRVGSRMQIPDIPKTTASTPQDIKERTYAPFRVADHYGQVLKIHLFIYLTNFPFLIFFFIMEYSLISTDSVDNLK